MKITVPTLTEETYYQDTFYMSNSRFKEYIDCPLRQQYGYELTPYIAAVSKEPIPDKEIIWITDDILLSGKEFFEAHVDNIRDVFLNHTTPQGCGYCDFCLTHKKLTRSITLDELI